MSFLMAQFYDRFMSKSEDACLRQWRAELLADVRGDVLEVGAGTGANLAAYPRDGVRLTLCEPDEAMRARLVAKRGAEYASPRVTDWPAERLGVDDNSQDVVVTTLVCCSVTDLGAALAEFRRVLRPGGRFVFLEHVGAEQGSGRRRVQNVLNPAWRKLAGNCHLNRDTEAAIAAAGFELESVTRESMRKALPFIRPTVRGVARLDPQRGV